MSQMWTSRSQPAKTMSMSPSRSRSHRVADGLERAVQGDGEAVDRRTVRVERVQVVGRGEAPPPMPWMMSTSPSPLMSPSTGLPSELPGRYWGQPALRVPASGPVVSKTSSRESVAAEVGRDNDLQGPVPVQVAQARGWRPSRTRCSYPVAAGKPGSSRAVLADRVDSTRRCCRRRSPRSAVPVQVTDRRVTEDRAVADVREPGTVGAVIAQGHDAPACPWRRSACRR